MELVSVLDRHMQGRAFSHYGVTPLERPLSIDVYRQWLERGYHGDMAFLAESTSFKAEPQTYFTRAHSAIVVAKSYVPHPYGEVALKGVRTALYAQGGDYHTHFKQELEDLARGLRLEFPGEEFLCFADTSPILERDLAYRAGLGWVGKNTCLIHPRAGSLFVLGQLMTSVRLSDAAAGGGGGGRLPDLCGTCDRCIRACPTGAIESPRTLNAQKCISYLTIETREDSSLELRSKIGDWLFGCDICQTVCPWNEKAHGRDWMRSLSEERAPDRNGLLEDLRWILRSSNKHIEKTLASSPILRARATGLKRNALVVIGNKRLHEMRADAEFSLSNPRLKKVAEWALAQLT